MNGDWVEACFVFLSRKSRLNTFRVPENGSKLRFLSRSTPSK